MKKGRSLESPEFHRLDDSSANHARPLCPDLEAGEHT